MKTQFLRSTAALLALLAASASFASCGDTVDTDSVITTDTAAESISQSEETEPLTEMEKRALMEDDLPEKDFGGKPFRISTKAGYMYEIDTEEETGDILNDALFARNLRIEERFNTEIVPVITETHSAHIDNIRNSIMAGDDAFDLTATYVYTTGGLVTEGCFLNWRDMPYNDLSKPWWINGVNEKFEVDGVIYNAVGDMCVSTLKLTYAVFYNRTKGQDYDLNEVVYDAVRDGTWTIDKFSALTREIYTDLNGDSIRNGDDFYGFVAEANTNVDIYPLAFDIPIIESNENGIPTLQLNTTKAISAVEKLNSLYWDNAGTYIPENSSEPISHFAQGKALFTTTWLGNAFDNFRTMEDNYSILPYPKWDEEQETYLTGAMDNYSVLGIPMTAQDTEMISILTEALNIESYKTLYLTYYEQALQDKYARDAESIEMIDMIMQGRSFGFVELFISSIPKVPKMFRELVAKKSTDFVSAYTKAEKGAQKALDKILAAYEENADK